jgi:hypothetical protein
MIVSVGFLISAIGFGGFLLIVLRALFAPDMLPGYSSTVSLILFLAGVQSDARSTSTRGVLLQVALSAQPVSRRLHPTTR